MVPFIFSIYLKLGLYIIIYIFKIGLAREYFDKLTFILSSSYWKNIGDDDVNKGHIMRMFKNGWEKK